MIQGYWRQSLVLSEDTEGSEVCSLPCLTQWVSPTQDKMDSVKIPFLYNIIHIGKGLCTRIYTLGSNNHSAAGRGSLLWDSTPFVPRRDSKDSGYAPEGLGTGSTTLVQVAGRSDCLIFAPPPPPPPPPIPLMAEKSTVE